MKCCKKGCCKNVFSYVPLRVFFAGSILQSRVPNLPPSNRVLFLDIHHYDLCRSCFLQVLVKSRQGVLNFLAFTHTPLLLLKKEGAGTCDSKKFKLHTEVKHAHLIWTSVEGISRFLARHFLPYTFNMFRAIFGFVWFSRIIAPGTPKDGELVSLPCSYLVPFSNIWTCSEDLLMMMLVRIMMWFSPCGSPTLVLSSCPMEVIKRTLDSCHYWRGKINSSPWSVFVH